MKKLILSAAIILGSFTAFAQDAATTQQNQGASQTDATAKTEQSATTSQEGYKEVKLEEVPEAVTKAFKESYPDAVLGKVFVNANKEYKIKITLGDKSGVVYADANGKWLQK